MEGIVTLRDRLGLWVSGWGAGWANERVLEGARLEPEWKVVVGR